jgi:hypothetical protein
MRERIEQTAMQLQVKDILIVFGGGSIGIGGELPGWAGRVSG